MSGSVIVIGLGEIGRPLFEIIRGKHAVIGVDVKPVEARGTCSIMHVCFPFAIHDFTGECLRYIDTYRPGLTIINSTVAAGTTRLIEQRGGTPVVNSPVRGKHRRMREELLEYTKYVGGTDPGACRKAASHFEGLGMRTKVLSSPEATEIAKLSETTYFGVLIAWAQEVERYCDRFGLDYDEVVTFFDEIGYLPRAKFFPGVIGGHCVMPNIEILQGMLDSPLLEGIRKSNELKKAREASRGSSADPGRESAVGRPS